MIFVGSRYAGVEKIQAVHSSGISISVYETRPTTVAPVSVSNTHRVNAGETMETLAYDRFGNANKWYLIADMNPHVFWPLDLQAGDKLVIPSKAHAALR
jgi:nucleoid-associated protein YgaU